MLVTNMFVAKINKESLKTFRILNLLISVRSLKFSEETELIISAKSLKDAIFANR